MSPFTLFKAQICPNIGDDDDVDAGGLADGEFTDDSTSHFDSVLTYFLTDQITIIV